MASSHPLTARLDATLARAGLSDSTVTSGVNVAPHQPPLSARVRTRSPVKTGRSHTGTNPQTSSGNTNRRKRVQHTQPTSLPSSTSSSTLPVGLAMLYANTTPVPPLPIHHNPVVTIPLVQPTPPSATTSATAVTASSLRRGGLGSRATLPSFVDLLLHPEVHPALQAIKSVSAQRALETTQIADAKRIYAYPQQPWHATSRTIESLTPQELMAIRSIIFAHPDIQIRLLLFWILATPKRKSDGLLPFAGYKAIYLRFSKRFLGRQYRSLQEVLHNCDEDWMRDWGGSREVYQGCSQEFSHAQALPLQGFLQSVFEMFDLFIVNPVQMSVPLTPNRIEVPIPNYEIYLHAIEKMFVEITERSGGEEVDRLQHHSTADHAIRYSFKLRELHHISSNDFNTKDPSTNAQTYKAYTLSAIYSLLQHPDSDFQRQLRGEPPAKSRDSPVKDAVVTSPKSVSSSPAPSTSPCEQSTSISEKLHEVPSVVASTSNTTEKEPKLQSAFSMIFPDESTHKHPPHPKKQAEEKEETMVTNAPPISPKPIKPTSIQITTTTTTSTITAITASLTPASPSFPKSPTSTSGSRHASARKSKRSSQNNQSVASSTAPSASASVPVGAWSSQDDDFVDDDEDLGEPIPITYSDDSDEDEAAAATTLVKPEPPLTLDRAETQSKRKSRELGAFALDPVASLVNPAPISPKVDSAPSVDIVAGPGGKKKKVIILTNETSPTNAASTKTTTGRAKSAHTSRAPKSTMKLKEGSKTPGRNSPTRPSEGATPTTATATSKQLPIDHTNDLLKNLRSLVQIGRKNLDAHLDTMKQREDGDGTHMTEVVTAVVSAAASRMASQNNTPSTSRRGSGSIQQPAAHSNRSSLRGSERSSPMKEVDTAAATGESESHLSAQVDNLMTLVADSVASDRTASSHIKSLVDEARILHEQSNMALDELPQFIKDAVEQEENTSPHSLKHSRSQVSNRSHASSTKSLASTTSSTTSSTASRKKHRGRRSKSPGKSKSPSPTLKEEDLAILEEQWNSNAGATIVISEIHQSAAQPVEPPALSSTTPKGLNNLTPLIIPEPIIASSPIHSPQLDHVPSVVAHERKDWQTNQVLLSKVESFELRQELAASESLTATLKRTQTKARRLAEKQAREKIAFLKKERNEEDRLEHELRKQELEVERLKQKQQRMKDVTEKRAAILSPRIMTPSSATSSAFGKPKFDFDTPMIAAAVAAKTLLATSPSATSPTTATAVTVPRSNLLVTQSTIPAANLSRIQSSSRASIKPHVDTPRIQSSVFESPFQQNPNLFTLPELSPTGVTSLTLPNSQVIPTVAEDDSELFAHLELRPEPIIGAVPTEAASTGNEKSVPSSGGKVDRRVRRAAREAKKVAEFAVLSEQQRFGGLNAKRKKRASTGVPKTEEEGAETVSPATTSSSIDVTLPSTTTDPTASTPHEAANSTVESNSPKSKSSSRPSSPLKMAEPDAYSETSDNDQPSNEVVDQKLTQEDDGTDEKQNQLTSLMLAIIDQDTAAQQPSSTAATATSSSANAVPSEPKSNQHLHTNYVLQESVTGRLASITADVIPIDSDSNEFVHEELHRDPILSEHDSSNNDQQVFPQDEEKQVDNASHPFSSDRDETQAHPSSNRSSRHPYGHLKTYHDLELALAATSDPGEIVQLQRYMTYLRQSTHAVRGSVLEPSQHGLGPRIHPKKYTSKFALPSRRLIDHLKRMDQDHFGRPVSPERSIIQQEAKMEVEYSTLIHESPEMDWRRSNQPPIIVNAAVKFPVVPILPSTSTKRQHGSRTPSPNSQSSRSSSRRSSKQSSHGDLPHSSQTHIHRKSMKKPLNTRTTEIRPSSRGSGSLPYGVSGLMPLKEIKRHPMVASPQADLASSSPLHPLKPTQVALIQRSQTVFSSRPMTTPREVDQPNHPHHQHDGSQTERLPTAPLTASSHDGSQTSRSMTRSIQGSRRGLRLTSSLARSKDAAVDWDRINEVELRAYSPPRRSPTRDSSPTRPLTLLEEDMLRYHHHTERHGFDPSDMPLPTSLPQVYSSRTSLIRDLAFERQMIEKFERGQPPTPRLKEEELFADHPPSNTQQARPFGSPPLSQLARDMDLASSARLQPMGHSVKFEPKNSNTAIPATEPMYQQLAKQKVVLLRAMARGGGIELTPEDRQGATNDEEETDEYPSLISRSSLPPKSSDFGPTDSMRIDGTAVDPIDRSYFRVIQGVVQSPSFTQEEDEQYYHRKIIHVSNSSSSGPSRATAAKSISIVTSHTPSGLGASIEARSNAPSSAQFVSLPPVLNSAKNINHSKLSTTSASSSSKPITSTSSVRHPPKAIDAASSHPTPLVPILADTSDRTHLVAPSTTAVPSSDVASSTLVTSTRPSSSSTPHYSSLKGSPNSRPSSRSHDHPTGGGGGGGVGVTFAPDVESSPSTSIVTPPQARLVGIELNPGPEIDDQEDQNENSPASISTSPVTRLSPTTLISPQTFFKDGLHLIYSYLALNDWLACMATCHHWYATGQSQPCRHLTLDYNRALLPPDYIRRHFTSLDQRPGYRWIFISGEQLFTILKSYPGIASIHQCGLTSDSVSLENDWPTGLLVCDLQLPEESDCPNLLNSLHRHLARQLTSLYIGCSFPPNDFISRCLNDFTSLTHFELQCFEDLEMDFIQDLELTHLPLSLTSLSLYQRGSDDPVLDSLHKLESPLNNLTQLKMKNLKSGDLQRFHQIAPNLTMLAPTRFSFDDFNDIHLFRSLHTIRLPWIYEHDRSHYQSVMIPILAESRSLTKLMIFSFLLFDQIGWSDLLNQGQVEALEIEDMTMACMDEFKSTFVSSKHLNSFKHLKSLILSFVSNEASSTLIQHFSTWPGTNQPKVRISSSTDFNQVGLTIQFDPSKLPNHQTVSEVKGIVNDGGIETYPTIHAASTIRTVPAPELVGIEPNPGPNSIGLTSQTLFKSGVHLIFSFLSHEDWSHAFQTSNYWYECAASEPSRHILLDNPDHHFLPTHPFTLSHHITRVGPFTDSHVTMKQLIPILTVLPQLTMIRIHLCGLYDLPKDFQFHFRQLTDLDLCVSGMAFPRLMNAVFTNRTLKRMVLSGLPGVIPDDKSCIYPFSQLTSLTSLRLAHHSNIKEPYMIIRPEDLQSLSTLSHLTSFEFAPLYKRFELLKDFPYLPQIRQFHIPKIYLNPGDLSLLHQCMPNLEILHPGQFNHTDLIQIPRFKQLNKIVFLNMFKVPRLFLLPWITTVFQLCTNLTAIQISEASLAQPIMWLNLPLSNYLPHLREFSCQVADGELIDSLLGCANRLQILALTPSIAREDGSLALDSLARFIHLESLTFHHGQSSRDYYLPIYDHFNDARILPRLRLLEFTAWSNVWSVVSFQFDVDRGVNVDLYRLPSSTPQVNQPQSADSDTSDTNTKLDTSKSVPASRLVGIELNPGPEIDDQVDPDEESPSTTSTSQFTVDLITPLSTSPILTLVQAVASQLAADYLNDSDVRHWSMTSHTCLNMFHNYELKSWTPFVQLRMGIGIGRPTQVWVNGSDLSEWSPEYNSGLHSLTRSPPFIPMVPLPRLRAIGLRLDSAQWHSGDECIRLLNMMIQLNPSPHLRIIHFCNCDLTDEGARIISSMIRASPSLTHLNLAYNRISRLGVRAICGAIQSNPSVISLDLDSNIIGHFLGTAAGAFGGMIEKSQIQQLHLRYTRCIFNSGDCRRLADGLKHSRTMSTLYLDCNQIGDVGLEPLAGGIRLSESITELSLNQTDVTDVGVRFLADAIAHSISMRRLILSWNKITDAGAIALGDALHHSQTMESLYVRHNQIGDAGARSLAIGFEHCRTMTSISFDDNPPMTDIGREMLNSALKLPRTTSPWNLRLNTGSGLTFASVDSSSSSSSSSMVIPPQARLVGIELNPGPMSEPDSPPSTDTFTSLVESSYSRAQTLFRDGLHLIYSYLYHADWFACLITCQYWLHAAESNSHTRHFTLNLARVGPFPISDHYRFKDCITRLALLTGSDKELSLLLGNSVAYAPEDFFSYCQRLPNLTHISNCNLVHDLDESMLSSLQWPAQLSLLELNLFESPFPNLLRAIGGSSTLVELKLFNVTELNIGSVLSSLVQLVRLTILFSPNTVISPDLWDKPNKLVHKWNIAALPPNIQYLNLNRGRNLLLHQLRFEGLTSLKEFVLTEFHFKSGNLQRLFQLAPNLTKGYFALSVINFVGEIPLLKQFHQLQSLTLSLYGYYLISDEYLRTLHFTVIDMAPQLTEFTIEDQRILTQLPDSWSQLAHALVHLTYFDLCDPRRMLLQDIRPLEPFASHLKVLKVMCPWTYESFKVTVLETFLIFTSLEQLYLSLCDMEFTRHQSLMIQQFFTQENNLTTLIYFELFYWLEGEETTFIWNCNQRNASVTKSPDERPSTVHPPSAPLVGIELNPGPSSNQAMITSISSLLFGSSIDLIRPQTLFKDGLHHIYSYLTTNELFTASCTCRYWLRTADSDPFVRELVLSISDDGSILCPPNYRFVRYITSAKPIPPQKDVVMSIAQLCTLVQRCPKLTSIMNCVLTFRSVDLTPTAVQQFRWPSSLTALDLMCLNSFPNLINSISQLSSSLTLLKLSCRDEIGRMIMKLDQLKSLSLDYPLSGSNVSSILTNWKLISLPMENLTYLNLLHGQDAGFIQYVQHHSSRLTEVDLSQCYWEPGRLQQLVERAPNILTLQLRPHTLFPPELVLLKEFAHLQSLTISYNVTLNEAEIITSALSTCVQLTHLNVNAPNWVPSVDVWTRLSRTCTKLTNLHIWRAAHSYEDIFFLLPLQTQLRALTIQGSISVQNQVLFESFLVFTHLHTLTLISTEALQPQAIDWIQGFLTRYAHQRVPSLNQVILNYTPAVVYLAHPTTWICPKPIPSKSRVTSTTSKSDHPSKSDPPTDLTREGIEPNPGPLSTEVHPSNTQSSPNTHSPLPHTERPVSSHSWTRLRSYASGDILASHLPLVFPFLTLEEESFTRRTNRSFYATKVGAMNSSRSIHYECFHHAAYQCECGLSTVLSSLSPLVKYLTVLQFNQPLIDRLTLKQISMTCTGLLELSLLMPNDGSVNHHESWIFPSTLKKVKLTWRGDESESESESDQQCSFHHQLGGLSASCAQQLLEADFKWVNFSDRKFETLFDCVSKCFNLVTLKLDIGMGTKLTESDWTHLPTFTHPTLNRLLFLIYGPQPQQHMLNYLKSSQLPHLTTLEPILVQPIDYTFLTSLTQLTKLNLRLLNRYYCHIHDLENEAQQIMFTLPHLSQLTLPIKSYDQDETDTFTQFLIEASDTPLAQRLQYADHRITLLHSSLSERLGRFINLRCLTIHHCEDQSESTENAYQFLQRMTQLDDFELMARHIPVWVMTQLIQYLSPTVRLLTLDGLEQTDLFYRLLSTRANLTSLTLKSFQSTSFDWIEHLPNPHVLLTLTIMFEGENTLSTVSWTKLKRLTSLKSFTLIPPSSYNSLATHIPSHFIPYVFPHPPTIPFDERWLPNLIQFEYYDQQRNRIRYDSNKPIGLMCRDMEPEKSQVRVEYDEGDQMAAEVEPIESTTSEIPQISLPIQPTDYDSCLELSELEQLDLFNAAPISSSTLIKCPPPTDEDSAVPELAEDDRFAMFDATPVLSGTMITDHNSKLTFESINRHQPTVGIADSSSGEMKHTESVDQGDDDGSEDELFDLFDATPMFTLVPSNTVTSAEANQTTQSVTPPQARLVGLELNPGPLRMTGMAVLSSDVDSAHQIFQFLTRQESCYLSRTTRFWYEISSHPGAYRTFKLPPLGESDFRVVTYRRWLLQERDTLVVTPQQLVRLSTSRIVQRTTDLELFIDSAPQELIDLSSTDHSSHTTSGLNEIVTALQRLTHIRAIRLNFIMNQPLIHNGRRRRRDSSQYQLSEIAQSILTYIFHSWSKRLVSLEYLNRPQYHPHIEPFLAKLLKETSPLFQFLQHVSGGPKETLNLRFRSQLGSLLVTDLNVQHFSSRQSTGTKFPSLGEATNVGQPTHVICEGMNDFKHIPSQLIRSMNLQSILPNGDPPYKEAELNHSIPVDSNLQHVHLIGAPMDGVNGHGQSTTSVLRSLCRISSSLEMLSFHFEADDFERIVLFDELTRMERGRDMNEWTSPFLKLHSLSLGDVSVGNQVPFNLPLLNQVFPCLTTLILPPEHLYVDVKLLSELPLLRHITLPRIRSRRNLREYFSQLALTLRDLSTVAIRLPFGNYDGLDLNLLNLFALSSSHLEQITLIHEFERTGGFRSGSAFFPFDLSNKHSQLLHLHLLWQMIIPSHFIPPIVLRPTHAHQLWPMLTPMIHSLHRPFFRAQLKLYDQQLIKYQSRMIWPWLKRTISSYVSSGWNWLFGGHPPANKSTDDDPMTAAAVGDDTIPTNDIQSTSSSSSLTGKRSRVKSEGSPRNATAKKPKLEASSTNCMSATSAEPNKQAQLNFDEKAAHSEQVQISQFIQLKMKQMKSDVEKLLIKSGRTQIEPRSQFLIRVTPPDPPLVGVELNPGPSKESHLTNQPRMDADTQMVDNSWTTTSSPAYEILNSHLPLMFPFLQLQEESFLRRTNRTFYRIKIGAMESLRDVHYDCQHKDAGATCLRGDSPLWKYVTVIRLDHVVDQSILSMISKYCTHVVEMNILMPAQSQPSNSEWLFPRGLTKLEICWTIDSTSKIDEQFVEHQFLGLASATGLLELEFTFVNKTHAAVFDFALFFGLIMKLTGLHSLFFQFNAHYPEFILSHTGSSSSLLPFIHPTLSALSLCIDPHIIQDWMIDYLKLAQLPHLTRFQSTCLEPINFDFLLKFTNLSDLELCLYSPIGGNVGLSANHEHVIFELPLLTSINFPEPDYFQLNGRRPHPLITAASTSLPRRLRRCPNLLLLSPELAVSLQKFCHLKELFLQFVSLQPSYQFLARMTELETFSLVSNSVIPENILKQIHQYLPHKIQWLTLPHLSQSNDFFIPLISSYPCLTHLELHSFRATSFDWLDVLPQPQLLSRLVIEFGARTILEPSFESFIKLKNLMNLEVLSLTHESFPDCADWSTPLIPPDVIPHVFHHKSSVPFDERWLPKLRQWRYQLLPDRPLVRFMQKQHTFLRCKEASMATPLQARLVGIEPNPGPIDISQLESTNPHLNSVLLAHLPLVFAFLVVKEESFIRRSCHSCYSIKIGAMNTYRRLTYQVTKECQSNHLVSIEMRSSPLRHYFTRMVPDLQMTKATLLEISNAYSHLTQLDMVMPLASNNEDTTETVDAWVYPSTLRQLTMRWEEFNSDGIVLSGGDLSNQLNGLSHCQNSLRELSLYFNISKAVRLDLSCIFTTITHLSVLESFKLCCWDIKSDDEVYAGAEEKAWSRIPPLHHLSLKEMSLVIESNHIQTNTINYLERCHLPALATFNGHFFGSVQLGLLRTFPMLTRLTLSGYSPSLNATQRDEIFQLQHIIDLELRCSGDPNDAILQLSRCTHLAPQIQHFHTDILVTNPVVMNQIAGFTDLRSLSLRYWTYHPGEIVQPNYDCLKNLTKLETFCFNSLLPIDAHIPPLSQALASHPISSLHTLQFHAPIKQHHLSQLLRPLSALSVLELNQFSSATFDWIDSLPTPHLLTKLHLQFVESSTITDEGSWNKFRLISELTHLEFKYDQSSPPQTNPLSPSIPFIPAHILPNLFLLPSVHPDRWLSHLIHWSYGDVNHPRERVLYRSTAFKDNSYQEVIDCSCDISQEPPQARLVGIEPNPGPFRSCDHCGVDHSPTTNCQLIQLDPAIPTSIGRNRVCNLLDLPAVIFVYHIGGFSADADTIRLGRTNRLLLHTFTTYRYPLKRCVYFTKTWQHRFATNDEDQREYQTLLVQLSGRNQAHSTNRLEKTKWSRRARQLFWQSFFHPTAQSLNIGTTTYFKNLKLDTASSSIITQYQIGVITRVCLAYIPSPLDPLLFTLPPGIKFIELGPLDTMPMILMRSYGDRWSNEYRYHWGWKRSSLDRVGPYLNRLDGSNLKDI